MPKDRANLAPVRRNLLSAVLGHAAPSAPPSPPAAPPQNPAAYTRTPAYFALTSSSITGLSVFVQAA